MDPTDTGQRLRFEQMLSDLSARFVNLPAERIDAEIESALEKIRTFFEVDRCGLLRIFPAKASWRITHVATTNDVPGVPIGMELPRAINPWAYAQLTEKHAVVKFARVGDMPAEAQVDKQTWREWSIRSNLTIPILSGDKVDHIIAINSVRRERVWPEAFIPRLQLLGEIFVNALERRKGEQALRESEARLNLAAESARGRRGAVDAFPARRPDMGHRQTARAFSICAGRRIEFRAFYGHGPCGGSRPGA